MPGVEVIFQHPGDAVALPVLGDGRKASSWLMPYSSRKDWSSGGPTKSRSFSSGWLGKPKASRAYWADFKMPSPLSATVPSRSNKKHGLIQFLL